MATTAAYHRCGGRAALFLAIRRPRPSTHAAPTLKWRALAASSSSSSTVPTQQGSADTQQQQQHHHHHHHHHDHSAPPRQFDWEALFEERKVWVREDAELVKDLRSDHAGETGAVYIYRGAEAAMRLGSPNRFSPGARAFVDAHKRTEEQHLAYFDKLLDPAQRSKLLPLWRLSGFTLGFLPTVVGGERALFCTVEAVETFVEVHYNHHILPLAARPPGPYRYLELLRLLRHCCEDEVHHKDDARDRWLAPGEERPLWARLWAVVVGKGSEAAVAVCRNI